VWVFVTSRANVGWNRACVTASNPDANSIGGGSLNAVPMKLMPTGMASTSPAGTWKEHRFPCNASNGITPHTAVIDD
jgi:hypothetical protein